MARRLGERASMVGHERLYIGLGVANRMQNISDACATRTT